MKRLSIVIPIFNCEKYISNFLDELLKQIDTSSDEIILVNDGSKDKSEDICKLYKEKYDKNIKFYTISNSGPSRARNIGINNAEGKYLIFLDIDDEISSNYIEKMLENIEEYDLIISGYNLIKVDKNETVKVNLKTKIINKKNIIDLLQNDLMLNTLWNKIFKLDIIKNNKIKFDEEEFRGEDLLFNLDYISNIKKDIFIIEDILYNYYMKSTGLNLGYSEKIVVKFRRTNKIYKKMKKITCNNKNKLIYMTIKSYFHHIIFFVKKVVKRKNSKN